MLPTRLVGWNDLCSPVYGLIIFMITIMLIVTVVIHVMLIIIIILVNQVLKFVIPTLLLS